MNTVLIAEDDPVSRRIIEATLRKWGYEVVVACDGKEAMKVLKYGEAPRLAILDWMMPGMDGIQICKEIRKASTQQYTYIILLTAKSHKQDVIAGLDSGADDYITKPFDSHELKARLHAGSRIMDLQAELLSMREELENRATHDFLTGLPNRLLFSDRLNQKDRHSSPQARVAGSDVPGGPLQDRQRCSRAQDRRSLASTDGGTAAEVPSRC